MTRKDHKHICKYIMCQAVDFFKRQGPGLESDGVCCVTGVQRKDLAGRECLRPAVNKPCSCLREGSFQLQGCVQGAHLQGVARPARLEQSEPEEAR